MLGIVVLAGGEGRRMGGRDKGLCLYNGRPFIEHTVRHIKQQIQQHGVAAKIVISANRNLQDYGKYGFPLVTDLRGGVGNHQGPLAGIESALSYGIENGIKEWLTWPVDSLINFPQWLEKMHLDLQEIHSDTINQPISVLQMNARKHYTHLGLQSAALPSLQAYLEDGNRSIKGWLKTLETRVVVLETLSDDLMNCNQIGEYEY